MTETPPSAGPTTRNSHRTSPATDELVHQLVREVWGVVGGRRPSADEVIGAALTIARDNLPHLAARVRNARQ